MAYYERWRTLNSLFPKPLLHSTLLRYIGVGGTAAIVDLGVFQTLSIILPAWHYLLCSTISFLIATWVNYLLSIRFVFLSGAQYGRSGEITLVYLVSLLGLAVHHATFYYAVEFLSLPILLGKISGMGCAFFWNFSSRRYWIFRT